MDAIVRGSIAVMSKHAPAAIVLQGVHNALPMVLGGRLFIFHPHENGLGPELFTTRHEWCGFTDLHTEKTRSTFIKDFIVLG